MNIAEFAAVPLMHGLKPQVVLGDQRRQPTAWIPGGRENGPYDLHAALARIPRAAFVALTPGAFTSRTAHQHDEEPAIYFLGWDYDTDNAADGDEIVSQMLTLPDYFGVRRSAGGRGVHVFCLFDRVVTVPGARRWTRRAARLLADQYAAFSHCASWLCKADYRAFWFAPVDSTAPLPPRAFEWAREPEPRFDPTQLVTMLGLAEPAPPSRAAVALGDDIASDLLPLVAAITPLLGGVTRPRGRHSVNVAAVRDALADTRWAFETVAKGRPEHRGDHNGFVDIAPDRVVVYSSPDGHPVLDVKSSAHWAGVLGS